MSKSAAFLELLFLVKFGLDVGLWQFKPHMAHFNKSPPWLELIKLHKQTPPSALP